MGRAYVQISFDDRCEIAKRCAEGQSLRKIATALGRAPSSITRELKRNAGKKVGYQPAYANEQTKARRWKGSKLERKPMLQADVLTRLAQGHSPEQIAGRMARDLTADRVSHETIYRFIYAQITRTKDFSWRHYLPRAKSKRGIRGTRGGSPASFIQGRISVHARDVEALDRISPGHWEADLVSFAKYGQFVLTLQERTSRLLLAARPENKNADLIAKHLFDWLECVPQGLRKTLTFDNGTEFARHLKLHPLGLQTFFCDPHAPWQKGGIENAHGRLRRFLPRKTDLDQIDPDDILRILQAYNATPRKCLDFQTPAEVFLKQLVHFKCESTSQPAPG
jgi:transposase, IS30 family